MIITIDTAALRALLEKATKGEWAYRPIEFDDWGVIRDVETGSIVAIARAGGAADLNAHRAAKTDPYEPNGALIVAALNALPALLDEVEMLRKVARPLGMERRGDLVSERDELIQIIGCSLDHPNVYMGGASPMNKRKAENIINLVAEFYERRNA